MGSTNLLRDNGFSGRPVYLSDLSACQPNGALSRDAMPRRWRTMEYEAEGLSGVMLIAGPETAAPEISLPLNAAGWHAVSLGLFADQRQRTGALVRLSGDDTFSVLDQPPLESEQPPGNESTPAYRAHEVREMFWRVVDLTGRDLVLGQMQWRVAPGEGQGALTSITSRVAYVKITPLTDAEAAAAQADAARTDTGRLFAHNDAHGPHFSHRPTTAEVMRRELECFRGTDFSRIYWETGSGDILKYFSKLGRLGTYDDQGDFGRRGDRMHAESWRSLIRDGIDPFEAALSHAHDLGMELHASYRVAGFHYPPPLDYNSQGPTFYKFSPRLRSTDKMGRRTPRLSYAYPELRRYVISLLEEMAGYDVEGVCLLYNRRPPVVEYDPPLVESFQAKYGEDPRQLDDEDPRWLAHKAGALTQFHREVRQAMDEVAEERKLGRRIQVSAVTMRDERENMLYGMDLKAWIDEGLVDTIIPYTSERMLDSAAESWSDPESVRYFVELTRGTGCKLAPNIMPRQMSADDYRSRIAGLYSVGVENFLFWDCAPNRANFTYSYDAMRRLGHRDEIEAWSAEGRPSHGPTRIELKQLGGWDYRYATPG